MQKKIIVIGGGAAGFFCAVNAARMNNQLEVIILEKANKVLAKVKVSGGGRCNVAHANLNIAALAKNYPRGEHFLKKAFHQFNTQHTVDWFQERGVDLKTETDGRMFPITNSSQTIIDCLMNDAHKYKVQIKYNTAITSLVKENNQWVIITQKEEKIIADNVCIACGGFAKEESFRWIKNLGHSIELPVPSLFTFNIPNHSIHDLMGVSIENATVKIKGTKWQMNGIVLITHWGLSGPAILKLSAFAARELHDKKYNFSILVNWVSEYNETQLRDAWGYFRNEFSSAKMINKNPFKIPNRLWNYLLNESEIDENVRWNEVTSKQQNKLVTHLTSFSFSVKGKTTFKEEFVTAGGVKLSEIDVNTMQSKMAEGIYFAGEIIDVDGITGGFNFQNAWTTGFIAAQHIAKK